METCQIREQRTPQKRRGAISAEVYTDEEVFFFDFFWDRPFLPLNFFRLPIMLKR